jgi:glycosyltransferase involved in cell wall biosynthesis
MANDVHFIGPLNVQSGMGRASRSYHMALQKLANYNLRSLSYREGHEAHPFVDYEIKSSIDLNCKNLLSSTAIYHQNADGFHIISKYYAKYLSAPYKKKIALWVWELSNFKKEWIHQAKLVNEIWVPSTFVKKSIESVIDVPVNVIPYPIEIDEIGNISFKEKMGLSENFIFGFFFDASSYVDRKNPVALINAFNKIVKNYPNCRLVLKISHSIKFIDYLGENDLLDILNPKIIILERNLTQIEMNGLMSEIDCYVSPHRSEGFGLTIAEAMIIGVPVICTNYSAPCDFINEKLCYPVAFNLVEIKKDLGPYQKGMKWAEINQDELQQKMLYVLENIVLAKKKAQLAKLTIGHNYSYQSISNLMSKYL